MYGAKLFANLERFRADKARFLRRVNPLTSIEEANDSNTGGNGATNAVSTSSTAYPARYCPNSRCNNLLRGEVPTKPPKAPANLPKNDCRMMKRSRASGHRRCNSISTYRGAPILVCSSCSSTTCAACGGEEGHLGLTCEEQKRYAVAAAELEKEAASLKWLSDFTKVQIGSQ